MNQRLSSRQLELPEIGFRLVYNEIGFCQWFGCKFFQEARRVAGEEIQGESGKKGSVWQFRRNNIKLRKKYNKTCRKHNKFCNECNLIVFRTIFPILKQEMPMLLIVVTFLAGATWGPQVSMQAMPKAAACTAAMNAVAQTILDTAKSNLTSEVLIKNDGSGGLQIITGVNQRIITSIACK